MYFCCCCFKSFILGINVKFREASRGSLIIERRRDVEDERERTKVGFAKKEKKGKQEECTIQPLSSYHRVENKSQAQCLKMSLWVEQGSKEISNLHEFR